MLENGSLIFERVAKDSEGHYLCEARNDIGAGLSKLIFLKVNGKWIVRIESQSTSRSTTKPTVPTVL